METTNCSLSMVNVREVYDEESYHRGTATVPMMQITDLDDDDSPGCHSTVAFWWYRDQGDSSSILIRTGGGSSGVGSLENSKVQESRRDMSGRVMDGTLVVSVDLVDNVVDDAEDTTNSNGSNFAAGATEEDNDTKCADATIGSSRGSPVRESCRPSKERKGTPRGCQDRAKNDDALPNDMRKPPSRPVTGFSNVVIHRHAMILGDHPAVRSGPPIALGWEVEDTQMLTVDEYEEAKHMKCGKKDLVIQESLRERWLLQRGYNERDFARVAWKIRATKASRLRSRADSMDVDCATLS